MKSKLVKNILILAVVISLLGLCGCGAKPLTGITSFSYGYSGGTYAYSGCDYTADLKDSVVNIAVRLDGSEDIYTTETGPEFMDKLTDIANEFGLSSWNGFNKYNHHVMDGDGFSLSLKTDSDQTVEASGYMSWPKNYSDATEQIEALFMELFENTLHK